MRPRGCTRRGMSEPIDWAEDMEARLLEATLLYAPRLGWTSRAIAAGARDIGMSPAEAELLAPNGARDLAALMARRHDLRAMQSLGRVDVATLKIRERIRLGVLARCDAAMEDQPATRRWAGFLALPPHIPLAVRLTWASADALWRWAGDTATDENHYSKRALVGEILISTLALRIAADAPTAAAHLDGRIEAVMAFERWKAGIKPGTFAADIATRLGGLRHERARSFNRGAAAG